MNNARSGGLKDTHLGRKVRDQVVKNAQVLGGPRRRGGLGDIAGHEGAHTDQGQQLGPFYLPSNLMGGLLGLARDGDWHGPSNWNEGGPQEDPPRPWSVRRK